jgi:hypothetical protein
MLSIVDIVLRVGVDQIIIERHLVLLEVRNSGMIDLECESPEIHIIAFNLPLNILNLSCQVSDAIHDRILRLEKSFHGFLPRLELLKLLGLILLALQNGESSTIQLRLFLYRFDHSGDV